MAAIANVALSNTFDTWRIRSNQVFTRMNQFAIKESALYANTVTANNNLTAKSGANVNFLGSNTFLVTKPTKVLSTLTLTGLATAATDVAGAVNEVKGEATAMAIALG